MADLNDFDYTSILDMSNDEAIDTLRQIRLSRRIPEKKTTTRISTKQIHTKTIATIDANMAANLLKILEGNK
jgi:hypothetical protein